MTPKILVIGKTGQVATELAKFDETVCYGRDSIDLAEPEKCRAFILSKQADVVINAAAYTAVDKAESEPDLAMCVNGTAVGALAAASAEIGAAFLHVSTDYVFDGTGERPWQPADKTEPKGVYGATKLAGETLVASSTGDWAILRTSWVFSAHGNNFVKTMLRLSVKMNEISVVDDQVGGPTSAASIAAALMTMAKAFQAGAGTNGVFHFAGTPVATWADFAQEIFQQSNIKMTVNRIPSSEYKTPAERPKNSRMNCETFEKEFNFELPDWRADLSDVLADLRAQGEG